MAKHSILWSSLLHPKSTLWRNRENPLKTEMFLNKILSQPLEWHTPPAGYFSFSSYQGKSYSINRNGIVKSLDWEIMKPYFHKKKRWWRIRIKVAHLEWDTIITKEKEITILSLMDSLFWPYLKWFEKKKQNPNGFILVPKDWDYNNCSWENLEYTSKALYREKGTKRGALRFILETTHESDKEIAERTHIKRSEIQKQKMKLVGEGKLPKYRKTLSLREELWFTISQESLPIYEALLQCWWKLSNWELATIIYKEAYTQASQEEKKRLASKFVRARKQLTDRGLLQRYNDVFESKKSDAIKMLSEKSITGHTNQEIAETLWLRKTQIDNLARQIRKSVKK